MAKGREGQIGLSRRRQLDLLASIALRCRAQCTDEAVFGAADLDAAAHAAIGACEKYVSRARNSWSTGLDKVLTFQVIVRHETSAWPARIALGRKRDLDLVLRSHAAVDPLHQVAVVDAVGVVLGMLEAGRAVTTRRVDILGYFVDTFAKSEGEIDLLSG